MPKVSELKELYDNIGGVNAVWISSFQNAYSLKVYKLDGVEPLAPMQYFEMMCEEGYSLENVRKIVDMERQAIKDFDSKFSAAESLINSGRSGKDIKQLLNEMDELVDLLRVSYIVLGPEYIEYEERLNELRNQLF
jgi:hypothetical protein